MFIASSNGQLFYWRRDSRGSNAEVDYLIERDGEIVPVEIKSGKSGRITSLHLLLDNFPSLKTAYVLTENKQMEIKDQRIRFLPLFCTSGILNK